MGGVFSFKMFHNYDLCLTRGKTLDELFCDEETFLIVVFFFGKVGYRDRLMLTAEVVDRAVAHHCEAPGFEVLDVMEVGAVVPERDETILNDVGSEVLVVQYRFSQTLHARLQREELVEELLGGVFHIYKTQKGAKSYIRG